MPYKSKSRKRRVDKMPTDACAGSAVINMSEVSASQTKVTPKSKPILMSEFDQYYQQNRADSGLRLAEEYEQLREVVNKNRSTKMSQLTINKPKNRFVNILPYDHSIVTLNVKNGVIGSDYINANYIPGFNCEKEYIASQGPLNSTVNDFYRMIIENNVKIVVMLTQCIEKGRQRCEKYWPSSDDIDEESTDPTVPQMTFDDISVQLLDERIENDFVIRDLKITKDDSDHFLTQYHFIEWPDFGCPQNPYSLIHLIEDIRKQYKTITTSESVNSESQQNICPILVHCSAGVGRSGTFIAVDTIMQSLDNCLSDCDHSLCKDISIDVFNTVCEMRKFRQHMVQTEDQYIYIYDCVKYLMDRIENKNENKLEKTICDNEVKERSDLSIDPQNEQNSGLNIDNELGIENEEELTTGAHINRQFSLDESSENTEL